MTGPSPAARNGNRLLLAGMLAYAVAFLLYYPRTFAIVDEDAYLTQALLFRSGALSYDESPIPAPHMTVDIAGRQVSKYPPGNSLFLLPFTALGWRAAFLSGLVLALAGTLLFASVLRRLHPDADPAWALLYLCYPPVVLLSRTLMSDLLAATAVLLAFALLLRRGWWMLGAGLALGFACLVRYSNAILVPVFILMACLTGRQRIRAALLVLGGTIPGLATAALYNAYAFGGPLAFPMYLTGLFAPGFFFRNLWFYAGNLILLYPLMLVAPAFAGRGRRLLLALPAGAVLLVYCFFSYIHAVPSLAERLTIGMRYLLPAAPFWILAFAIAVERLAGKARWTMWGRDLGIAAMLALAVLIHARHARHLEDQDRYRQLLYESMPASALVVCDKEVSELISHAWGDRSYLRFAEFDVPVPVQQRIAGTDTVYAAMLEEPGHPDLVETTIFETLLARNGGGVKVIDTEEPRHFRLYRLKPVGRLLDG